MQSQLRKRSIERLECRDLLAADIVLNEIHYDPPDKTQYAEFIELYNNSGDEVDLGGWRLSDGIDFTFPTGTSIGAGQYVVVAEDPATIRAAFGVASLGPWFGSLKNEGERIELRDSQSALVDEVDYGRGFPWPVVGDETGGSIELIHPSFDNDLGGNWRRAGAAVSSQSRLLVSPGENWRYLPGTAEPSRPTEAYRDQDFDDSTWLAGSAPIGYGDSHVRTTIDMQSNYSTLYLRKSFDVSDPDSIAALTLAAQFDDGFNMWINGVHVAGSNVSGNELGFDSIADSAIEDISFVEFALPAPSTYLVRGQNVIAVQLLNASRTNSSDAWFDAFLMVGATGDTSPGEANTVFATNAPPTARQISHPDSIVSDQDVVVTVKVTDPDGVRDVTLQYQVVKPGDYFGRYLKSTSAGNPVLDPRYDDPAAWTTVVMSDDGRNGNQAARDDYYTTIIPGSVNQHRHLVRYRIQVADNLGAVAQLPYADDPQFNFAYFVYDGAPDWTGAARPGASAEITYDFDQLGAIATYQLLTRQEDHHDAQHIPDANTTGYAGSEYLWPGTMVYDGVVYDNIHYRSRGGVWRYAMGKNMWKFDFNRAHGFEAKDNYGQAHAQPWDKLNFSAIIQQGNYLHRGEQGLFESVGFKLFNLAGVESPNTHYVHFRIIDAEDEFGSDQFSGDFRGLYLAVEQPDGNMLEEHGLPDGNFYKIENYAGTSNNQGPTQVDDGSDVIQFISAYRDATPTPEWWEANLDLDRYFSYRAIVEAIHHYDIAYGKNYFYYHNPETGKFQIHPWDLDLTWADNMYGSGEHDFSILVAQNPAFKTSYQNRVREITDLLYNSEQTGLLIDEFASVVYTSGQNSWVDADRAMWDYNPIMTSSYVNPQKSGAGRFYRQSDSKSFPGMVQLMKDYVVERSKFLFSIANSDRNIPDTPTVAYRGEANHPIDGLQFQASPFRDPQGAETFAAMEWRIAEITDPDQPSFDRPPLYEIIATEESGVLRSYEPRWSPSTALLRSDALYRVRVRMQDTDGQWSHWSDPVQFATAAANPLDVQASLRISEIHYHPADPSEAERAAGFVDADDFEFLELINTGTRAIDLSDTALVQVVIDGREEGVAFDFSTANEWLLFPGERFVVVEDAAAFALRYGTHIPVVGEWNGKLSNSGERLTIDSDGVIVLEFTFDDSWYPTTDGGGYSLDAIDPTGTSEDAFSSKAVWKQSDVVGGTPGTGSATTGLRGDVNADLQVNAIDIDLIFSALSGPYDSRYDANGDQSLSLLDIDFVTGEVLNVYRGDADLNGQVDFADFLQLAAAFGQSAAGWSQGDFDGDRLVAFSDFLLFAENFGKLRPTSPATFP